MTLPEGCEKCAPFAGAWRESENGLMRCDCPRGAALSGKPKPAEKRDPVLSESNSVTYAEMLAGGMDFYPAESAARSFIASEIAAMCDSDYSALCLVRDMHRRYDGQKWPGVVAMRAVLCAFADPLDGLQAIEAGIEAEQEQAYLAIAAPPARQLASGKPATASPSIAGTVADLVRAKDLGRALKRLAPPPVREVPVVKVTDANRITDADVKAEVEKLRTKRAAAEVGET